MRYVITEDIKMKKFAPFLVLICLAGLAWFFISSSKAPKTATHTHQDHTHDHTHHADQELIVVTPWEVTSADPSKSGFLFQRLQLAETLVDADQDANLQPMLAKSWSANESGDTWVFSLRDDVVFHDGSALSAHDVVKSLTVALTKPTALKSALIQDIQAIDAHTVQFKLEKPLMSFPAYLAHATSIILAKSSFDADDTVSAIIGTGPYQVVSIEPPQKIEQKRFADYWGDKAKIEHVTYLANSRSETRTLLAQSKPNYLVFTLDSSSLNRLAQDPNVQVQSQSLARTIQYKVNAAHPLFQQAEVRQALSDAIDRQGIAQSVMRSDSAVAWQILPPIFKDWQIHTTSQKPDAQAIKQKLLNLGFEAGDDGMLLKDGKPAKFTLRTFSDRPELPIIATALQAQWRQIGFDVDVSVGNFSEIPAGHQDGSLQMALYARNYGMIPDPLGSLLEDFAPDGSDWGAMNWQNAELTQRLLQLESQNTTDTAIKHQVASIIYNERPITPVVYYQQNAAHHKSLKGLQIDGLERNFYLNKLYWE